MGTYFCFGADGCHVPVSIDLCAFSETDYERLIEWIDSPRDLLQWAGPVFSYPLDAHQLQDHLAEATDENPVRRAYKATNSDEQIVGYIELNNIDLDNDSGTISRVLVSPDERGQGIGTEMVRRATKLGFRDLGLHRIGLRVFDFNEAAIACYKRVGFKEEGKLRDSRRHEDEYWTLIQMSMLEDEW